MGANATTFVPSYTSGEVLTAANLSVTNSGIPVFATTVTRDAAFGGTGEKTLAEGQFAYIEATNLTQYYDGAAWQNVGVAGLTYITQATPSAVNSVSIDNCFTSTYQNYLVTISNTALVGTNAGMHLRLRASSTDSTTNYSSNRIFGFSTTVGSSANPDGTDEFSVGFCDSAYATSYYSVVNIGSPNNAVATKYNCLSGAIENSGVFNQYFFAGAHTTASAYDGFTIRTAGTSFTGTIRVYGYQNS
jgi:hypothetical protein